MTTPSTEAALAEAPPSQISTIDTREVIAAPDLKTTVGNAAIGLVSGFIAKKAILGKTNNPLTKLLGILIEMVVAGKVVKNADGIKSFGGMLLNKFIGKDDKV